jgi:hypothetical protein
MKAACSRPIHFNQQYIGYVKAVPRIWGGRATCASVCWAKAQLLVAMSDCSDAYDVAMDDDDESENYSPSPHAAKASPPQGACWPALCNK